MLGATDAPPIRFHEVVRIAQAGGKSRGSHQAVTLHRPRDSTVSEDFALAPSLPRYRRAVPLTNVTAVLLVLALTGIPVARAACVIECHRERATSGHCHVDLPTSVERTMSANSSCNDVAIGENPYVIELRAVPGAVAVGPTSLPTTLMLAAAPAPAVVASTSMTCLKPALVLRL